MPKRGRKIKLVNPGIVDDFYILAIKCKAQSFVIVFFTDKKFTHIFFISSNIFKKTLINLCIIHIFKNISKSTLKISNKFEILINCQTTNNM